MFCCCHRRAVCNSVIHWNAYNGTRLYIACLNKVCCMETVSLIFCIYIYMFFNRNCLKMSANLGLNVTCHSGVGVTNTISVKIAVNETSFSNMASDCLRLYQSIGGHVNVTKKLSDSVIDSNVNSVTINREKHIFNQPQLSATHEAEHHKKIHFW